MPSKQLSITKSKAMLPVIDEAKETFPDAATDAQALTRALFHWFHNRQQNSKRASLDRTEQKLNRMDRKLDILVEHITHDTDHA
jgi:hypothetical protein